MEGVLHHIDDDTAVAVLACAAQRLVSGGRLVAIDPVLLERQNPVARALALVDRGKHVRALAGCRALADEILDSAEDSLRRFSGQLRELARIGAGAAAGTLIPMEFQVARSERTGED